MIDTPLDLPRLLREQPAVVIDARHQDGPRSSGMNTLHARTNSVDPGFRRRKRLIIEQIGS